MVKINEKYYISADVHNYILKEKKTIITQDGEEKEIVDTYGYYATLEGCLRGVMKNEIRKYLEKEQENTVKEMLELIQGLEQEISKTLTFLDKKI